VSAALDVAYPRSDEKILVVDDDQRFLQFLAREITRLGYTVLACDDADSACAATRDHRVAVVMSDLRMPGMDGLQLATWVSEHSPETEFIMVTGDGSLDPACAAVRIGITDYLTKPLDLRSISESLERALDRYRSRSRIRDALAGRVAGIAQIFDWLPQAIIVCNGKSAVLAINRSARELLHAADALCVDAEGRLAVSDPEKTATVREVIAGVAHPVESDSVRPRPFVTITRWPQSRSLGLLVLPIAGASDQPLLAVLVSDPDRRATSSDATLQHLYGLTTSEARLAVRLLQGLSLETAAGQLGIATNTARVHLRRIFEKTGTGRQVDLVSLLLCGPALFGS
jgi:FixJ family two-component response regulator